MFSLTGNFTFLSYRKSTSKDGNLFAVVWLLCDNGTPVQFFVSKSLSIDDFCCNLDTLSSGDLVSVTFIGNAFSNGVRLTIKEVKFI